MRLYSNFLKFYKMVLIIILTYLFFCFLVVDLFIILFDFYN